MFQRLKNMSLHEKRALWGWVFIAPWIIGFAFFFMFPLIQSLIYSFSELTLTTTGMTLEFNGLANYIEALTVNVDFNRTLIEVVVNMLVNVPLIVIFSLFVAVLLNQQFKGRMLARAVFFLPVILASGAIYSIESGDFLQNLIAGAGGEDAAQTGFRSFQLEMLLLDAGINEYIVEYLTGAV